MNFLRSVVSDRRMMLTLNISVLVSIGCGADEDTSSTPSAAGDASGEQEECAGGLVIPAPETYAFGSRFDANTSSVSVSGQHFRHLLIDRLTAHIGGLTARAAAGEDPCAGAADCDIAAQIVGELNFFYRFDSDVAGEMPHGKSTSPEAKQTTWNDVSSGKDLSGKIAGNDAKGQHVDWSTAGLAGWSSAAPLTPEAVVDAWFSRLGELYLARLSDRQGTAPNGSAIDAVHVSPEGHDYAQLLQKFLLGAVAFSQGADDYLDDDTEGKGLRAQNCGPDKAGKAYTSLEHAWDEGFGYFGAAMNFGAYEDGDVAGKDDARDDWKGANDADADGRIDLTSELNWGHSVNAQKRDRASAAGGAPTDFTQGAWDGFIAGRTIIANAGGTLTDQEMADLVAARDKAVSHWEKAISATAIHYVNDVLGDMAKAKTCEVDAAGAPVDQGCTAYSFETHAKHWGELKGFALSLQFNRLSPMSDARFAELHQLLGDAPVLPNAEGVYPDANGDGEADYVVALRQARSLLGEAYGFDSGNVEGW